MHIKSTVVRYSLWVIALTLLLGAVALAPPRLAPARAAALSPGCQSLLSAGNIGGYGWGGQFYAGEVLSIKITALLAPATEIYLAINGPIVDTVTAPGDFLTYTFPADGLYSGVIDDIPGSGGFSFQITCGPISSGSDKGTHDTPPFQPAVQPYDGDDANAIAALAAPDGRLACGLFDLASTVPHIGHGFKTAYLPGWPDCPPDGHDVDILCLNEEGAWVTPAFEDLQVREDGLEITWISNQDGVCGFFPQG